MIIPYVLYQAGQGAIICTYYMDIGFKRYKTIYVYPSIPNVGGFNMLVCVNVVMCQRYYNDIATQFVKTF